MLNLDYIVEDIDIFVVIIPIMGEDWYRKLQISEK